MTGFFHGLFYWTGVVIWLLVVCTWLSVIGQVVGHKIRRMRRPRDSWYGTAEQRRALSEAKAEAKRVLGKYPV